MKIEKISCHDCRDHRKHLFSEIAFEVGIEEIQDVGIGMATLHGLSRLFKMTVVCFRAQVASKHAPICDGAGCKGRLKEEYYYLSHSRFNVT